MSKMRRPSAVDLAAQRKRINAMITVGEIANNDLEEIRNWLNAHETRALASGIDRDVWTALVDAINGLSYKTDNLVGEIFDIKWRLDKLEAKDA